MAQRTVCLCEGKLIGIETIYTVINGNQINIPDKLKDLRLKSRQNKLYCPCGCGANLILVAGDQNLREQHFRLKEGEYSSECQIVTEGKSSVDSKIVLKCWLDVKLKDDDIDSRVPICSIGDSNRKYEYTFLSKKEKKAVVYCYDKVNLSDEKYSILEDNSVGIKIVYIIDSKNSNLSGQYPEGLMKIQNRQGYCLYLSIVDIDYYKANLRAVFFAQDIDGLWQEVSVSDGKLDEYEFDIHGNLCFRKKVLEDLVNEEKDEFSKKIEAEKYRRKTEEKQREEYQISLAREQEARRIEELRKKELEFEEYKRKQIELEKEQQIEKEKRNEEKRILEEKFKSELEAGFIQQKEVIRDSEGNRWIKCKYCGKIGREAEFYTYGGSGTVNLGVCYDCDKNNYVVRERTTEVQSVKKIFASNKCPKCSGQLVERKGKFGVFLGCSNFPECRYTSSVY